MITKDQNETIRELRREGIKFNHVQPVDRNVELFNFVQFETTGKERVIYVATVNSYGIVTDWGLKDDTPPKAHKPYVINADGEVINVK